MASRFWPTRDADLAKLINDELVGNLTKESGISLTGIANFLSNTFHLKTKVGMDWGNFGPENALEHIKQYTNFHGQRKSLRIIIFIVFGSYFVIFTLLYFEHKLRGNLRRRPTEHVRQTA